jgi:N-acetylglucosaminyl-diphospho-decaprenol L-rhamnosyltransferase
LTGVTTTVKNSVSIIIVIHNSLPVLTACLESLRRNVTGLDFEMIVVDNKSSDSPAETIKRIFPSARILGNPENVGFGAACNRAAAKATGEFLLFVNPDIELDRNAILNLRGVYEGNEKIGLTAARCRLKDGTFHPTCRNFPTIKNIFFSRGSFLAQILSSSGGRFVTYTLPDFSDNTIVPAVAGTLMMIRKSLFDKLNGFDRRFFMFMEDTDLSLRAVKAGYFNLFVPGAGAVHNWGRGSRTGRFKRSWYHHVSVWRYFLKHYPNPFSYILLPLLLMFNFILVSILPDRRKKG